MADRRYMSVEGIANIHHVASTIADALAESHIRVAEIYRKLGREVSAQRSLANGGSHEMEKVNAEIRVRHVLAKALEAMRDERLSEWELPTTTETSPQIGERQHDSEAT